jgi:CDP-diacylglycerol--glycerol-3-phosphate 3-phosphatidyltransferase
MHNKTSLPNMLSLLRIFFSLSLLAVSSHKGWFLAFYFSAVTSDVLDGMLARRWHCTSMLGSMLDSLGDAVLFLVLTILTLPKLLSIPFGIPIVASVVVLRCIVLLLTRRKTHHWMSIHTIANKCTGICILLCFPLVMLGFGSGVFLYGCCILSLLASSEELLILGKYDVYDPDRRSYFFA